MQSPYPSSDGFFRNLIQPPKAYSSDAHKHPVFPLPATESDPTLHSPVNSPAMKPSKSSIDNNLPSSTRPANLARYGSAPGSLLSSIADSIIGSGDGDFSAAGAGEDAAGNFFAAVDSACANSEFGADFEGSMSGAGGYDASFAPLEFGGFGDVAGGSHLIRHSSSPAGFFVDVLVDSDVAGLSPKGTGNVSQIGVNAARMKRQRLSSQWSFSHQDSFSQIPEINITGNIPRSSWNGSNSIIHSPNKRGLESHLSFPCTSLEMEAVEKYLNLQQDPVHHQLRAKRGCAMHPRSIAERERRTRISKRLRRLQDLVPNMDKQTNTSDMLDLALHYIKELQSQVQQLSQERSECTCTCKR